MRTNEWDEKETNKTNMVVDFDQGCPNEHKVGFESMNNHV